MSKINASVTLTLLMLAATLGGCSTIPEKNASDIPGQLEDGGWVMNIPGQPHTHRVVLAECPQQPLVITHTHDHNQVGRGVHKHNGCFVCPPGNPLVKRVLGG